MTGILLAMAIVCRAPALEVVLLIGAVHQPVLTCVVVLGLVAIAAFKAAKGQQVDPAVGRIVSVAGDLRAGKPLRAVLASGVLGDGLASIAESGRPIRISLAELSPAFGSDARLVQATLELATDGGGPVADAFDRLAAGMIESERTRRERRAALAPVVGQAVIVGGIPAALLAGMLVNGRWMALLSAGPASAAIALFGTVSLVAGIGWTVALIGRGTRQ